MSWPQMHPDLVGAASHKFLTSQRLEHGLISFLWRNHFAAQTMFHTQLSRASNQQEPRKHPHAVAELWKRPLQERPKTRLDNQSAPCRFWPGIH